MTTTADGVDRLEPCEDWRPYVVAAIPKPVKIPNDPDRGQRSGRRDSNPPSAPVRTLRLREGGLDLLRRAA